MSLFAGHMILKNVSFLVVHYRKYQIYLHSHILTLVISGFLSAISCFEGLYLVRMGVFVAVHEVDRTISMVDNCMYFL